MTWDEFKRTLDLWELLAKIKVISNNRINRIYCGIDESKDEWFLEYI